MLCRKLHEAALKGEYEKAQEKKDHFYDIEVSIMMGMLLVRITTLLVCIACIQVTWKEIRALNSIIRSLAMNEFFFCR